MTNATVTVTHDAVLIERVQSNDPGVVGYIRDTPEPGRADAVRCALALGVAGLRAVQGRADVDQVERGFDQLKVALERAFDPARKGSYLDQLGEAVDGYLGQDGTVAEAVTRSGEHVVKVLVEQITQLRDAVIGNIAAGAEREKGTLKGGDFESDVEAVLCRLARPYGDVVENVTNESGEAGRSKQGDFVVQLAEGPRFTVESKNMTSTITLRGGNGILASLDGAMLNRQAGFAIAVSKCPDALPGEVGSLNAYEGDKIVCAFGDDGEILEIAYRWARSILLLDGRAEEGDVDSDAIRAFLVEAGKAVAEVSKVKAKVNAITKSADEIRGIVEWNVARAKQALASAESALQTDATPEARAS